MSQEQWTAVDRYITDTLLSPDAALEAALKTSADAGLPSATGFIRLNVLRLKHAAKVQKQK